MVIQGDTGCSMRYNQISQLEAATVACLVLKIICYNSNMTLAWHIVQTILGFRVKILYYSSAWRETCHSCLLLPCLSHSHLFQVSHMQTIFILQWFYIFLRILHSTRFFLLIKKFMIHIDRWRIVAENLFIAVLILKTFIHNRLHSAPFEKFKVRCCCVVPKVLCGLSILDKKQH